MRSSFVAVGTVVVALPVGLQLRQASLPPARAAPLRIPCGVERWSVKTLTDGDLWKLDLTRRYPTVHQLNQLTRPARRPANGRTPAELRVYRVNATVTTSINEDHGDVDLVLVGSDGSKLIAEPPEPACINGARGKSAINAARLVAQDIQPGTKVVAVGVGFFDFAHKQTGHAKNYFELHPLLRAL